MLSNLQMRVPLSALSIQFDDGGREDILSGLRAFAIDYGFAINIANNPAKPSDLNVRLYRSDIRMNGTIAGMQKLLEIGVYRTIDEVPPEAIRQGVDGLRTALRSVKGLKFSETVFNRGDVIINDHSVILPTHNAKVWFLEEYREALRQRLIAFSEANNFAAQVAQRTPNPDDVSVYMFRDEMEVSASMDAGRLEMPLSIYRAGDRSVSAAELRRIFEALKTAIAEVPHTKFVVEKTDL